MARRTLAEKMARKTMRGGADECWSWTGKIQKRTDGSEGYGLVHKPLSGNSYLYAHRVAWQLANGPVPEGLDVCHTCDNRRCVNPAHLALGTRKENLQDAARKGRMGRALTPDRVREVKARLAAGESGPRIARSLGVNHTTIYKIKNGKAWQNLRVDAIRKEEQ